MENEKYPFPAKTLMLMQELFNSKRISLEEVSIINKTILDYLSLRTEYFDS